MTRRVCEVRVALRLDALGKRDLAGEHGADPETIEEVYEPYLVQNGFLQRTPRGRVATGHAYRHLGFIPPAGMAEQSALF